MSHADESHDVGSNHSNPRPTFSLFQNNRLTTKITIQLKIYRRRPYMGFQKKIHQH